MEILLVIFILGYFAQAVGNFILIKKVKDQQKITGLTQESQVIFFIGSLSRLLWTTETRLTNVWFIWVEMLLSVLMSGYILYLFHQYSHTKFHENISNPFNWWRLTIFCLILSFFFHPGTKNEYYFTKQMFVSFTMFMEACGLLPQIYLVRKLGEVETMTGHYMFCLAVSRLLRLIFWLMLYIQGDSFLYLVIADLLHTLFLADFSYFYLRSSRGPSILLH